MDLIFFVFGTAILLFSGDLLVRAAVDVSLKMSISPTIVGLTVIAFGTSAPELLVGVQATWNGFGGLALGNIIGSNITNILLILGMPALIMAVKSTDNGLIQNYYYMLIATLIFISFLLFGGLYRWQGSLLILLLCLFVFQAIFYNSEAPNNLKPSELNQEPKDLKFWRPFADRLPIDLQENILKIKFDSEQRLYQFVINHTNPVLDYLNWKQNFITNPTGAIN